MRITKILRLFVLFLIAALLVFVGAFYWWKGFPVSPSKKPIPFEIRPGGLQNVIGQLNSQGIPVNATLFELLVRINGNATRLRAGFYELPPGETPDKLMDRLVRGLHSYESITIIEGWTVKQMRNAIDNHPSLKGDTDHLTDAELAKALGIDRKETEGLFFPNTYFFGRGSSDMVIFRQSHNMLMKKLNDYWEARDRTLPYKTAYEALIMASIVEKETGLQSDRGTIAGVFTNRLRIGMKLQTDPTVIYGMGDKYKGIIYKSSLVTDTPYNTYTRFGLPPTPIALVGEAALRATFHPENTQALYFVSRGDGSSEFSTNLSDHNKAVFKFLRDPNRPGAQGRTDASESPDEADDS